MVKLLHPLYNVELNYVSIEKASTMQPLKFVDGSVISYRTLLGMWLLINADILESDCW